LPRVIVIGALISTAALLALGLAGRSASTPAQQEQAGGEVQGGQATGAA
jgi:hypothetical protein